MRWLLLILILLCVSCKTTVQQVPVRDKTIIKERIVPVYVGADSALIRMSLTCDSSNQVILKELTEVKSTSVTTQVKQHLNDFEVSFKTLTDTIYVPVTDTVITQEKPIVVEKKIIEYKQKSWQRNFMWIGITLMVMGVCFVGYKLYKIL